MSVNTNEVESFIQKQKDAQECDHPYFNRKEGRARPALSCVASIKLILGSVKAFIGGVKDSSPTLLTHCYHVLPSNLFYTIRHHVSLRFWQQNQILFARDTAPHHIGGVGVW